MKAQPIATTDSVSYWQIGNDVFRAPFPWGVAAMLESNYDVYGHPLGKRWECTRSHWNRFRTIYSATDIPDEIKA